jgi:hypothetical protein
MIADDAARRAFDTVRQIAHNLDYDTRVKGYPYVALRLSDGGSDGVSYATKREAVRHQVHEQQCAYFSFRGAPNGFADYKAAAIYLAYHRQAYDNGFRLPDPDDVHGGPDLIVPDMNEHMQNQLTRLSARWN